MGEVEFKERNIIMNNEINSHVETDEYRIEALEIAREFEEEKRMEEERARQEYIERGFPLTTEEFEDSLFNGKYSQYLDESDIHQLLVQTEVFDLSLEDATLKRDWIIWDAMKARGELTEEDEEYFSKTIFYSRTLYNRYKAQGNRVPNQGN